MDTPDNVNPLPPPEPPPAPFESLPPLVPRQPFPSWKQALITFFGSVVLAATSCIGFLASLGSNFEAGGDNFWSPAAAIVFCASLVGIFVGFIFIIMRAARATMDSSKNRAS
jgi:hypothetical protein